MAERLTSTVGGGLLRLPGSDLSDGLVEARLRSRPRAQRRAAPSRDPWPGPGIELAYAISISSWQWSLGPHCSCEFNARTVMKSPRPSEAKTKSNWRVAVVGVWRFV